MSLQAFAAALLDPGAPLPEGLLDPAGRPANARFAIYRNNVTTSLVKVLRAGFPVIEKLVGEAYFSALAVEFLRQHPPQTRLMMLYGAEFAGFLQAFPPLAHLPYLADVARLEQGLRASYHAADAAPLPAKRLTALSPEALLGARLIFAPGLVLIRSHWPVLSIWRANTSGAAMGPMKPEALVILRKGFEPAPHGLTAPQAEILARMLAGQTVGLAAEAAQDPGELAGLLTLLMAQGAVKDIA